MRVHVDSNRCQGHAMCHALAPTLFALGDIDGHAQAVDRDLDPAEGELARRAVLNCPEDAIAVSET